MIIKEKLVERQTVFEGRVVKLHHDKVELPGGTMQTREVVEHHGGVAILPILKNGKILLERQYRYASQQVMIEIPAGKLEKNEDIKACGLRELQEETGGSAEGFEFMCKFYPTVGYCTEQIYIYLATGVEFDESNTNFDEGEAVECFEYTLEQALEAIKKGEIIDGKTILAITYYSAITLK